MPFRTVWERNDIIAALTAGPNAFRATLKTASLMGFKTKFTSNNIYSGFVFFSGSLLALSRCVRWHFRLIHSNWNAASTSSSLKPKCYVEFKCEIDGYILWILNSIKIEMKRRRSNDRLEHSVDFHFSSIRVIKSSEFSILFAHFFTLQSHSNMNELWMRASTYLQYGTMSSKRRFISLKSNSM